MKKKLLLLSLLALAFVFVLAFSVSANTLVPSDSNEYGELSVIDGVPEPSTISKTAKAVIKVSDKYYTIPTYYLLKDNTNFTWSIHTNVQSAFGISSVKNNLIRIEIPEGIKTSVQTSNGGAKFERYNSLIEASLPTSLELMGEYFFSECSALTTVNGLENTKITELYAHIFYGTKVSNITLPQTALENATFIGNNAFRGTGITSFVIPKSVKSIGNHAFAGCNNLTSVTFYKGETALESLGQFVFENAPITSFTFTSNFKTMGAGVFNKCTKLTTVIDFDKTQVVDIPSQLFAACPITSIALPQTAKTIGSSAFNGLKLNQDVLVIPNGVTTIGDHAFADCGTVGTLVLPANLSMNTSSGNYPFEKMSFSAVYIPQGVTAFPQGAFKNTKWSGVAYFFAGTKAQAEALKNNSSKTDDNRFSDTELISLADYNNATDNDKSSKRYLIYDVNHCDAFYGGNHNLGEATPVFTNGAYISDCNLVCSCSRTQCNAGSVTKETLAPLFGFSGFAVQESDGNAIMQSFSVNRKLLSKYTEVLGELDFGLLVALEKLPTDESSRLDGNLYTDGAFNQKVYNVSFYEKDYDIFEMKLKGIKDNKDALVYLCAFVIVDGKISYLHNGTVSEAPTAFSYNSVIA